MTYTLEQYRALKGAVAEGRFRFVMRIAASPTGRLKRCCVSSG